MRAIVDRVESAMSGNKLTKEEYGIIYCFMNNFGGLEAGVKELLLYSSTKESSDFICENKTIEQHFSLSSSIREKLNEYKKD